MPSFVVVGHRAATSPDLRLEDLPGAGRTDVLVRCVGAALLVSHGVRRDAAITLLLLGPPLAPRAVRFTGSAVRRLNPDERSTAALLRGALGTQVTAHVWQTATPGVEVARRDLAAVLEGEGGAPFVLDEEGEEVRDLDLPADAVFVVGDHEGFTEEERGILAGRGARSVRVGPVSLQADQAIVVLWNELDRRASRAGPQP